MGFSRLVGKGVTTGAVLMEVHQVAKWRETGELSLEPGLEGKPAGGRKGSPGGETAESRSGKKLASCWGRTQRRSERALLGHRVCDRSRGEARVVPDFARPLQLREAPALMSQILGALASSQPASGPSLNVPGLCQTRHE